MASTPSSPTRFPYSRAALAAALDTVAREHLHLAEGTEVELRAEDGRIILEPVRPQLPEPGNDVAAHAARTQRLMDATEHAMAKHHELLGLLAR